MLFSSMLLYEHIDMTAAAVEQLRIIVTSISAVVHHHALLL